MLTGTGGAVKEIGGLGDEETCDKGWLPPVATGATAARFGVGVLIATTDGNATGGVDIRVDTRDGDRLWPVRAGGTTVNCPRFVDSSEVSSLEVESFGLKQELKERSSDLLLLSGC